MWRTELYAVFAVLACVVVYLSRKTRLTYGEKKLVFVSALAAFVVVGLGAGIFFFGLHADLYDPTNPTTGLRDQDTALTLLSAIAGVAAALGVLAYADRIQSARTDAHFDQLARDELARIEQARRDADAAKQLQLDTQLRIAHTRQQTLLTAGAVQQRQAATNEAEQVLFEAFDEHCRRANVFQHKTKDELRDEFRLELARRTFPKLNLRDLERSSNPEVQQLLKRPNIKLAPE